MSAVQARDAIRAIKSVHHGAFDYNELEELGLHPGDLIDFSVNSNPFGPSPAVNAALQDLSVEIYPDREALSLRRALAARWDRSPDCFVAGNGTSELLLLTALAFIDPGDIALVLAPTYGEYVHAIRITGGEVRYRTATADRNFRHDLQRIDEAIERLRPRLVFLCSPNNPTGVVIPPAEVQQLAVAHPATLFVIDEAYRQFVPELDSAYSPDIDNILVLVSMTKDYAIAGLRLGYAVGAPYLIRAIADVRPPWNVNAAALAAGQAALEDEAHFRQSMARLRPARDDLFREIAACGYPVIPTETHYGLVHVGDGAGLRAKLLPKGIIVRDCASFGLPEYVRIATRRPEENRRLLEAIKEIIP